MNRSDFVFRSTGNNFTLFLSGYRVRALFLFGNVEYLPMFLFSFYVLCTMGIGILGNGYAPVLLGRSMGMGVM